MRFVLLLAATIGLDLPSTVIGRVTLTAKVRYETQGIKPTWRKARVMLFTNEEMGSLRYGDTDYNAAVFWAKNDVTFIKLKGLNGCDMGFQMACLPAAGYLKGADQHGRAWEICTQKAC